MKKYLLLVLTLIVGELAFAQDLALTNGVYEQKEVIYVSDVSATDLYLRALEALSDWTGSNGKSKVGIDVQDKESGTIIFKGKDYMGYRNFVPGAVWDVWAEFTLKVRCKDGRAQLVVTIPSLWLEYSANASVKTSVALTEILPDFTFKTYRCKKACQQYVVEVPKTATAIISLMKEGLAKEQDDF